jgi:hypothetical protein
MGGPIAGHMSSYHLMQRHVARAGQASIGAEVKYRSINLPIDPAYSRYGYDSLKFECTDILAGAAALLTTEGLVHTEEDLLRTQDVKESRSGDGRFYSTEGNGGKFWERTENDMEVAFRIAPRWA